MHTFQPYPIDMLNMNPFTKIGKEWALISAGDKNKCNTMTVSWGGEFFSMSFFNEKYRDALSYCGKESGRNVDDKFKGAGLTPAFRHNIPYPDEANLVLLCRKMAAVPITEDTFVDPQIMPKWYSDNDMHVMYVGEIIEAVAR